MRILLFSILFIVTSVLSIMTMLGWELGIAESLSIVVVIGFSVDYVVHLAQCYSRSSGETRLQRQRDMLAEIGSSVFSGACTTLGASFFMLFAVFFMQFGVFMFSTIGFSFFWSMVAFVALVGLVGPEGTFGRIGV